MGAPLRVGVCVGAALFRRDRLLILRRVPESDGRSLGWDLPGGSVERGETLEGAVRREIAEETGLRAGPLTPYYGSMFAARSRSGRRIQLVAVEFRGRALGSGAPRLAAGEHDRFAWVTRTELRRFRIRRSDRPRFEAAFDPPRP